LILALILAVFTLAPRPGPARGQTTAQERSHGAAASAAGQPWRGVHIMSPGRSGLPRLKRAVVEKLAPMGGNFVILEVNYKFRFANHPELSDGDITREDARDLADTCRRHHVRLIPMFNCLGHQSWARSTFPLLAKHPELDETPQVPRDNKGIY